MRILFQGDSITDCLRENYDTGFSMGCGYPRLIQADLCLNRTDIEVFNCGVSGDRVTNLLARWKRDCVNLHPDIISILIGVNDVWHELNYLPPTCWLKNLKLTGCFQQRKSGQSLLL